MADEQTPVSTEQAPAADSPEVQAQALVNSISGSETPPASATPPQVPEGLDVTVFNQQLQQLTGIEDYTTIPTLQNNFQQTQEKYNQTLSQYNHTKGQYEKLVAESQLSPFANPFIEQLNQKFKNNEDPTTINQWASLHFLDVEGMSPKEAYMTRTKMENPTFNSAHMERHMENTFGSLPGKEDEGYDSAMAKRDLDIEMAGERAKAWLKEQTTDMQDPQRQEQIEALNQQKTRYQGAWEGVSSQIAKEESLLTFELNDKSIGGAYDFPGYKPKLSAEQSEELSGLLTEYAVTHNLPLTQESLPELMEYKQAILWNMHREDFLKHMLADYHSVLQEHFVKTYAGAGALPKGSESSSTPAQKNTQKANTQRTNSTAKRMPSPKDYKRNDPFV